ncbi:MAG: ABC transporter permease, partial [Chloroflexota bacterium]
MRLVDLVRFAALVAVRRSRADWRIQISVAFGILLAVTLMAAGTIYSNALAETALRYTLASARPQDLDLTVTAYQPVERSVFGSLQRVVEERVRQPQAAYMRFHSLLVRSSVMYFSQQPILDLPEEKRLRGDLQAVPLLSKEVRVVEGRLPEATYSEMEVALDPLGASVLGLSVGQKLYAFAAAKGDVTLPVRLLVVGIVEAVAPGPDYWQLGNRYHFSVDGQTRWIAAPLYIDLDSLVDGVGKVIPGLPADFIWHYELKREELSAPQVNAVKAAVRGVEGDLKTHVPSSRWDTKLDTVLERHSALLTLARVPLLLVIFLVMGILLYYLFLVAGLMGRLRTSEVAVFRSRGASSWQVGQVLFMEGLLIALPATAVGPFVARGLVWVTGRMFPAGDQALAQVSLSPLDFLVGGIGGMLAVVVLTLTTVVAARQGVVAFGKASARPPTVPWFHRYYVDVALLGLIGLLWWQLRSRGSFLVRPLGGEGLELEATMLLGPVLTLLAGGLILLRLFPILVRLLSRFVEPLGPPWLVHGLRRTARDPVPWGSLMVLMALTTSLGALASAFSATLEKSQEDQARYLAGADVRIQYSQDTRASTPYGLASGLQSLPGVAKATDV